MQKSFTINSGLSPNLIVIPCRMLKDFALICQTTISELGKGTHTFLGCRIQIVADAAAAGGYFAYDVMPR